MASVFEIFNEVAVPLILLDEASQIMEPMAMVPITKFCADRLILIGDPLQVSRTGSWVDIQHILMWVNAATADARNTL